MSAARLADFVRRPFRTSRLFGRLAVAFGSLMALTVIVAPLDAGEQAVFAATGFALFLAVNRRKGRRATLFLAVLSCVVSLRYIHWRLAETLEFEGFWQTVLGTGLVLAEFYAVVALVLGYFQTVWPLDRKPAQLPPDPSTWPTVDVYVPTYNESMDIVRPTVFAAMAMDWPADKFNVYILDDGRRPEFRAFAEEVGCGYVIRPDNKGAKAGNINHALKVTDGEFIAIFDCDHAPTRAFLQLTMGWMLRDRGLAMVQTPHFFYSPDPFERNLHPDRRVPNEGLMFYGLVQPGNDLWNATFFCGSCAVMRRAALEEVGGVPTQTVTEDCHCSFKMQSLGWSTAYIKLPLASGLATERLAIHIGQRMRWARGMIQILRVENPLFKRGLRWHQRICYFMATFHFLFALPRVVFLTSPLAFLLFGINVIAASPLAIIAYAAPHIVHSVATGSRVAGHVRYSFWSEIYETALALWLLPLTALTLWNPSKGKFNVTDKGGTLERGYIDLKVVWPSVAMAALLLLGLARGLYSVATEPPGSTEFQAHLMNSCWALLCLVPIAASIAVGRERRQARWRHRIEAELPVSVVLPDGTALPGRTVDVSLNGAGVVLDEARPDLPPSAVTVVWTGGPGSIAVPAEMARMEDGLLKLHFTPRDLVEEGEIARAVLGRADAWLGWDVHRPDRPLRALSEVVYCSLSAFTAGLRQGVRVSKATHKATAAAKTSAAQPERRSEVVRPRPALAGAALATALCLPSAAWAQPARYPQQPSAPPRAAAPTLSATAPAAPSATAPVAPQSVLVPAIPPRVADAPAGPGVRHLSLTLRGLGQRGPMQLRGTVDQRDPAFGLRGDEVVTAAKLVVAGAMSPGLIPELSQLAFTMNDQFVGALQPDRARPAFGPVEMPVNPAFFSDTNRLGIRFTGSYTRECQDPMHGLLWATLSDLTALHLTLERLPPGRDLGRLPEPFFDPRITHEPLTLPVVLPDAAGVDALRAAAIATSWFAVQADYRNAVFPVAPSPPTLGHALLIAVGNDQPAPGGIVLPRFEGPTLAILPNPNDPFGLLLVVGGRTAAETAEAATALAAGGGAPLAGETAVVQAAQSAPRQPYDAPRWIPSDRPVRLGEMVDFSELQTEGYGPAPIRVPFRTAPDLYAWRNRPLAVDLRYRAPPGPVLDLAVSRLDLSVSGIFLKSLTLGQPEPSWPWSLLQRWWAEDDRVLKGRAGLPAWTVSGQNELEMRYDMRPLNRGECVAVPADIRAGVEPDSTIDLSGARRFTTLPNLAFFTGAGFPFTRLADLSETAVVLPDRPSAVEIGAFLGLVGKLSAIVGHPATGVQVARGEAGLELAKDRDLIVVGSLGSRFPALDRLLQRAAGGKGASVRLEGSRLAVALPDAMAGVRELFPSRGASASEERARASAQLAQPAEGLGALVGFESPLRPGRSVVALTGGTPAGLEAMMAAMRDPEQVGRVQGDLAIVAGGRVTSYRAGPTYSHGSLPIWLWPQYYMGGQPLLLLAGLALSSSLLGAPMYWALRRRAARRLRGKGH